ncbi:hypothetical protein SDC9_76102 [bioreactor metagenome]|uniref:Type II secretion system protein n=1 Tax=bioreactor metagenome TaxID=1076179 RepID=A0A644YLQ8_9ZZZZ
MNDQPLKPIKKHGSFSPVLIELAIVILFFALSTGIVVQLIAAASRISNESAFHSQALLAMETVAEETKAAPEGDGTFDECGVRTFETAVSDEITVQGIVTRDDSPENGTLYTIDLSVISTDGTVYTLTAEQYRSDWEATP